MGKRKTNQDVDINGPCPMEIDDILAPRGGVRKKRKTTIPKAVKIAVWERIVGLDIGRTPCSVCKTTFITQMDFHCGHIVAEVDGGETCVSNLVPICSKCNLSMGRTNLNTFKEQYFK
jgi:5-methylcytosine-specific restriction endonuclease McrA